MLLAARYGRCARATDLRSCVVTADPACGITLGPWQRCLMTCGPSIATINAPVADLQESLPTMLPQPSLTWTPYASIGDSHSGWCWGIPGEPRWLLPMASHIPPEHAR
jgi:hypothetical protein